MRRSFHRLLPLLIVGLLLLSLTPLPALAQTELTLTWEIPYQYSANHSYPGPDHLPELIGITRSDLTADSLLQLSLQPQSSEQFELVANLVVGDLSVQIAGQGSYGPHLDTPLLSGEFACQTETGVDCIFHLTIYPNGNQQQAYLVLGEPPSQVATVGFGQPNGNISAIQTQTAARLRAQAQLPVAYQLDGGPLSLNPAPIISDNQVLVPLRPLLQALGVVVHWDGATNTVCAQKGDLAMNISPSRQTLQVNGTEQPLFVQHADSGHLYTPLQPLTDALGATVIARRDGTVCLISREQTELHGGVFQIIFVSPQNVILQNDTTQAVDVGNWALIANDFLHNPVPMIEFRFPEQLILQPGEQVQVAAGLEVEPDHRLLFDWDQSQQASPELPARLQIFINSLRPGNEAIALQNRGADIYLGNWRLVATSGKPVCELPSIWLAQSSTFGISGRPGEPASAQELHWPNLPAVEEAYRAEQAARLESERQLVEALRLKYLPVAEALGIANDEYYFYREPSVMRVANGDPLPPLEEIPEAAQALLYNEMRLIAPHAESGDTVPAYYISPDGQQAYLAIIKRDGTVIAYHLHLVIDSGYYTWSSQQVMPA